MKVYTRTGDDGCTNGPDGRRVGKNDPGVVAVGDVDELNSHLGLCAASAGGSDAQVSVVQALAPIQAELFAVGATLAAARGEGPFEALLDDSAVGRMEQQIDAAIDRLGQLRHFVIPCGCELACRLHVARTVCRRAERAVAAYADTAAVPAVVLRYLNRLGDLLFVLARLANRQAGVAETPWPPEG